MENIENINHLWLIAGGLLIILEFIVMPGIGFLFAGLGALLVGILLQISYFSNIWQWVIFFGATLLWAALLWKPLKNFRTGHAAQGFSDIEGQKAILISNLEPGTTGKARWSGTIMNAKLEPSLKTIYTSEAEVTILRVEGNTLIVK